MTWGEDSSTEDSYDEGNFAVESIDSIPQPYILQLGSSNDNVASFLWDSSFIIYNDIDTLLKSFEHNLKIIDYRIADCEHQGIDFCGQFYSMILKYRHNVFSDLFKKMIGYIEPIETDISLKKWGFNLTPDFIIEDNEEIKIVEFTVCKTRERVDFVKGGGRFFELKYSEEAKVIAEIESKKVSVHMVCLTTKNPDFQDFNVLSNVFGFPSTDFKNYINRFLNIWNNNTKNIAPNLSKAFGRISFATEEMVQSYESKKMLLGTNCVDFMQAGLTEDQYLYMCNSRKRVLKWLKNNHEKNRYKNVEITYNINTCIFRGKFNVGNNSISEMIRLVEFGSLSELFRNCIFLHNNRECSVFRMQGNIKFDMPYERDALTLPKFEPIFEVITYSRTVPVYELCRLEGTMNLYNIDGSINYISDERLHYPQHIVHTKETNKFLFTNSYRHELMERINVEKYMEEDVKKKLLASNVVDDENIDDCREHLIMLMDEAQTGGQFRLRRSFIIPFPTEQLKYSNLIKDSNDNYVQVDLDSIDYSFGNSLPNSQMFTKTVLSKASEGSFIRVDTDPTLVSMNEEISRMESELHSMIQSRRSDFLNNKGRMIKRSKLLKILSEDDPIKKQIVKIQQLQTSRKNQLVSAYGKERSLSRTVRVNCSSSSITGGYFKKEMEHFNRKLTKNGVGDEINNQYEQVNDWVKTLFNWLISKPVEPAITMLFDEQTGPGPEFLNNCKIAMMEEYKKYASDFRDTNMAKVLEFASRLAHTLFKLSTITFNSHHVTLDNLGYSNVCLLVKGGKKIFQTSNSKLFRVIIPTNNNLNTFMGYNEDHILFNHCNNSYVCSPWMQINEVILKDTHSIYHRIFTDFAINLNRTARDFDSLKVYDMIPVLLAMHQKRQTEVALHNTRYLIVNPLGEFSNLKGILASFVSYNYSYFDAWLKHSIANNFSALAKSMIRFKNLKVNRIAKALEEVTLNHIITGETIDCPYDLVSMIYMTYTMSKGQYNKALEQAGNWRSIGEDIELHLRMHPNVNGLNDLSQQFCIEDNDISCYDDDFKYDPKFCQYLGYKMSLLLKEKMGISKVAECWQNCLSKSISSIANSNGLRGYSQNNFYNKKGYEVVTQFLVEEVLNGDLSKKISDIDLLGLKDKIKKFKDYNISLGDACRDFPIVDAIFHAVEKTQRAGSREIFVMDIYTKLYQNPIEAFMATLCKNVDNEMISVPSDIRPFVIHSKFYERKQQAIDQVYNFVLDCRKWAPHSVFQKYMHFLHGMSELLPMDFLQHFSLFFDKMMKKKFLTREYVYKAFEKNERYDFLKPFLIEEDANGKMKGTYSFVLSFSFVMGMFNYLSSLMHAANQLVADEIIRDMIYKKWGVPYLLIALVHSDDSTGKNFFSNLRSNCSLDKEGTILDVLKYLVALYDILLKAANHMISIKKSMISKIYQEFLSVLYLFNENVPMLRKYTGQINFQPTDKGYSVDVTYAVSKSLELLQNGGTMQESYICMKVTETYIRNFYQLPRASPDIPFNFMGLLDPHPIESWLGGTAGELFKHFIYNRINLNKVICFLQSQTHIMGSVKLDHTLKWDMGSRLPNKLRKKVDTWIQDVPEGIMDSWTVANGKFNNSISYILWFCSKTKDKTFYSALISDNPSKRMARIYGSFRSRSILTDFGLVKAENLYVSITEVVKKEDLIIPDVLTSYERILSPLMANILSIWESCANLDGMTITWVDSNLTLKPAKLSEQPPIIGNNLEINSSKLTTFVKEPDFFWLYCDQSDYSRKAKVFTDYLSTLHIGVDELEPDDFRFFVDKFAGNSQEIKRVLNYVESDNRSLRDLDSIFSFICTTSKVNKKIVIDNKRIATIKTQYFSRISGIPNTVSNFAKMHWFMMKVEDISCIEYLNDDFFELYDKYKKILDAGWTHLIENSRSTTKMFEMNYWSCWLSKQKRVGKHWVGMGKQIHRTPEIDIEVTIENTAVVELRLTVKGAVFSRSTQWYLNTVFENEVGMQASMKDSSDMSKDTNYLCYDDSNTNWSVNNSTSTRMFPITDECILPYWVESDEVPIRKLGKSVILADNTQYEIKTILDRPQNSITDIRRFINIKKVRYDKDNPPTRKKIQELLLILQGMVFDVPKISLVEFLKDAPATKLYSILYGNSDEEHVLLKSLIRHKDQNPNFGFPDSQMFNEKFGGELGLELPETIIRALKVIPDLMINEADKKLALLELYDCIVTGSTMDARLLQSISLAYQGKVETAIVEVMSFNINMLPICTYSFKNTFPHIEWVNDILIMIKNFLTSDVRVKGNNKDGWAQFALSFASMLDTGVPIIESQFWKRQIHIIRSSFNKGLLQSMQRQRIGAFSSTDFESINEIRFLEMYKCLIYNFCYLNVNWWKSNRSLNRSVADGNFQKLLMTLDYPKSNICNLNKPAYVEMIINKKNKQQMTKVIDLKEAKEMPANNIKVRTTCDDDFEEIIEAINCILSDDKISDGCELRKGFYYTTSPNLTYQSLLCLAGTAEHILVSTFAIERSIMNIVFPYTIYERNSILSSSNKQYIMLISDRKNIKIPNYRKLTESELNEIMRLEEVNSIKYNYNNKNYDTTIFDPENGPIMHKMIENAEKLYRTNIDPIIEMKTNFANNILINVNSTQAEEMAKKIKNLESTTIKDPFVVLKDKVVSSFENNKNVMRSLKSTLEKVEIPVIQNVTSDTNIDLLQDDELLMTAELIAPNFFNRVIRGEARLTLGQKDLIKAGLNEFCTAYQKTTLAEEARALKYMCEILVNDCKTSKRGDTDIFEGFAAIKMGLMPDVNNEELPPPLPRRRLVISDEFLDQPSISTLDSRSNNRSPSFDPPDIINEKNNKNDNNKHLSNLVSTFKIKEVATPIRVDPDEKEKEKEGNSMKKEDKNLLMAINEEKSISNSNNMSTNKGKNKLAQDFFATFSKFKTIEDEQGKKTPIENDKDNEKQTTIILDDTKTMEEKADEGKDFIDSDERIKVGKEKKREKVKGIEEREEDEKEVSTHKPISNKEKKKRDKKRLKRKQLKASKNLTNLNDITFGQELDQDFDKIPDLIEDEIDQEQGESLYDLD